MLSSQRIVPFVNSAQSYLFGRGELLPLRSELLWRIETGLVRTATWDDCGEMITLGVWGPGDWVGQPISRVPRYQIECLTLVQVTNFSLANCDLQESLLLHTCRLEEFLAIVQNRRISARLWCLLQWLAHRFGSEVDQGWLFSHRLTHQTLAEIIGTSRVTISRLIKQLEQEQKITCLGRSGIVIPTGISGHRS
jgi:CRP-like cAMP-binding protein